MARGVREGKSEQSLSSTVVEFVWSLKEEAVLDLCSDLAVQLSARANLAQLELEEAATCASWRQL
jgi:hypothetical protein